MAYRTWLPLGLLALAGCSSQHAKSPKPAAEPSAVCAASGASPLRPIGSADTGSTLALADWRGRKVAFVADEDERAVHTVDLETRQKVASFVLEGRPAQLLVTSDGRLVVAHRDRSELVVIEPEANALAERCRVPTAAEPVALALTRDRETLLVSSGWGRSLGFHRASDLAKRHQVDLPREPRAVVVSSDGKTAFVAHAVGGHASAVDLKSRQVREVELGGGPSPVLARSKLQMRRSLEESGAAPEEVELAVARFDENSFGGKRTSCQGFALAKSVDPAGRVLAPQVLVNPGDSTRRTSGYGEDTFATELPSVAVIDDRSGKPLPASLESLDEPGMHHEAIPEAECLLPRAAVVDPTTRTLLVACLGIDQLVGYDSAAASPARALKRRWPVASGPTGIALDGRRAVVWSQFDRALTFVPLDAPLALDPDREPHKLPQIALAENPARSLGMKARLGRLLFHASGDRRIARDGRACASCHPDGRDDGLVWATPNGPRRSVMLAGRVNGTAPFSWEGDHADLEHHLSKTFERLNGMGGLRSVELDSLIAYVKTLPAPPPETGLDPELVARGKRLFASSEVGCAGCHGGARFTDNDRHDVESKGRIDRSRRFNTPSLVHVGGRGPWFHDGRFGTLRELLVASDGKMGKTKHLSPKDLDALEAYLRTL